MKTRISLVLLSMAAIYGSSYELNLATRELDEAGRAQAARCIAVCHALRRFSAMGEHVSNKGMMAEDLQALEQALQRELDAVRRMRAVLLQDSLSR